LGASNYPQTWGTRPNEIALEFRERGEDIEDKAALGRGRIDGVLDAFEPHAPLHERRHHVDEMRERAAQAIKLPDD
jgi:hypothetical protein